VPLTDELRQQLKVSLIRDEGLKLKPYRDIVDRVTIGVGRNLDDCGISEATAMQMLDEDMEEAFVAAVKIFGGAFETFSIPRQTAIVNMLFNLGETKFRKFEDTIAAVKRGDWAAASLHVLASKWARQVGERAHRISALLRDG